MAKPRTFGRARRPANKRPKRSPLGDAAALLARRSRTESELRAALSSRHESVAVDAAITRLNMLGYLDDASWARHYVDGRRARGRGAILLRRELARHGVSAELSELVLSGRDERDLALTVAQTRLRALVGLDREQRYRRLAGFLSRRGFASDVVTATLHDVLDGEFVGGVTEEMLSQG